MVTPVAARSKARVCSRSLVGVAGSNGCLSLVIVVYCQVEVPALSCSLVQGILLAVVRLTECDREASLISRPWPTRVCCVMEEKNGLRTKY
jgi:hypothetical protein